MPDADPPAVEFRADGRHVSTQRLPRERRLRGIRITVAALVGGHTGGFDAAPS
jgi:hypothetical protein